MKSLFSSIYLFGFPVWLLRKRKKQVKYCLGKEMENVFLVYAFVCFG